MASHASSDRSWFVGSPELRAGRRFPPQLLMVNALYTDRRSSLDTAVPYAPEVSRGVRIKILHVLSHLGLGGTETCALKVVNGLDSAEFEHAFCAVRKVDAAFASQIDRRTPILEAGSSRAGFQFPLFRLTRIMRSVRPHIVHSRNFGALEAVAAARLARVPLVVHSEHGYEIETMGGLPLRRRLVCRALYAMTDALFTVTDDLRRYHSNQSWLDIEQFRVLPNGVDLERFMPRQNLAANLRTDLGIPTGRFVIGSVGRIVPIKDFRTLLRAAAILIGRGSDVHVLLVGEGPELGKLQTQVAETPELAGRVSFPGKSNRTAEFFNAMDVFVLPSLSEGMSNTVVEAMACGLPVAVTRVGGNPEVLGEGIAGALFSPGDAPGLAELLSRYMTDSGFSQSVGAACRSRAIEEFGLGRMLKQYGDLYKELAASRGIGTRN